jgi:two-component system, sensor histidine kinase
VIVAANGRQAFDAFLKEHFDLILMDVQMPELDGLEASKLIREDEQRRSLDRLLPSPPTPPPRSTSSAARTEWMRW